MRKIVCAHQQRHTQLIIQNQSFEGEVYELEYPDELLVLFPYGEFVSDGMFMPDVHLYCRCAVIREQ